MHKQINHQLNNLTDEGLLDRMIAGERLSVIQYSTLRHSREILRKPMRLQLRKRKIMKIKFHGKKVQA